MVVTWRCLRENLVITVADLSRAATLSIVRPNSYFWRNYPDMVTSPKGAKRLLVTRGAVTSNAQWLPRGL